MRRPALYSSSRPGRLSEASPATDAAPRVTGALDEVPARGALVVGVSYLVLGAWVAAGAFIGPGVAIGEGAVIGARSTVMHDVDPWTVVAGSPAKVRGQRPRFTRPLAGHR